jgi:glycosyltransferase involved in cell wall biosynthesis
MRIAYVTETWKPSINGVVTRLSVTIDGLIDNGHEVLVVAPAMNGDREVDAGSRSGLTVRRIPSFSVPFVYGGQSWGFPLPRVTRYVAEFEAEIVHLVAPAMLGIGGLVAAKRLRLPLVASFHTDIAGYARFYHLGFMTSFVWWWLRQIHNAAAINLVTSSYSARLLGAHRISRIVHWRRGVDTLLFNPARRRRPRDEDELPVALFVGRLAWEKGLQRLEALARSGVVRLMVVGDGPDRMRLERVFERTSTVFLGSLKGEELARVYADADVFVFSSTTETLGLVLLEALASGLPVIAAESPASIELLAANPAARLFPADRPEDAVAAVRELLGGTSAKELARLARSSATHWDWKSATVGLIAEYHRVLASSGTSGGATWRARSHL